MLLVETVRQQTAGVIDTIMLHRPPKPVKEGSTSHWDFAAGTWLENTAANQAYGKKVEEKRKEYIKNKHI